MPKNNLPTSNQKIIVIVGPTASGKSDLALRLAKLAQGKAFREYGINGAEIISADSRQVYRGMDIGTGKVTKKEQKMTRHYLLDVASPKKQFTASDLKILGEKAIKDISSQKKIPIIVGGTGFYIDILLGRMAVAKVPPNLKLRKRFDKLSAKYLFNMLRKLDPQRAKVIDPYNKRRLIRALEIILTTKKPSPVIKYPLSNNDYEILWLGVNPGKEKLAKNIKSRLEKRLERGMVREIKKLIKNGVSHKRLQKFGLEYKWLSLYLQNKISYLEMENELLRDIIRYSKRQMTWFKRNKEIHWLNLTISGQKETEKIVSTFLQKTTH